ncbi:zinc finger protein 16 isoform X2 [Sardina pilchardus]|uniref:zinc finger protein 16 isoform X2 n=1 Tax=Sardina pilchardus TaxID=27697 RepID=UPI002E11DB23
MTHVGFQTQIAGIIEDLANAAVAEICKVVENGYAVLQIEISQSRKQNDALKRKIQLLEADRDFASKYNRDRLPSVNQTCKIHVKKSPKKRTRTGDNPDNEAAEVHQMDGTLGFNSEDGRKINPGCTVGVIPEVITIKEEQMVDTGDCIHVDDLEVQQHGNKSSVDAQHRTIDTMPEMLDCRNIEVWQCAAVDTGERIKDENLDAYMKDDEPHIFEESGMQEDKRDTLSETHEGLSTSYRGSNDTISQHSLLNPGHDTDSFSDFHPVNSPCHEGNSSNCSYTTATDLHQEKMYHVDSFRHRSELSRDPGIVALEPTMVGEMPSLSSVSTTLEYTGIQHRPHKQWFVGKKGGKACPSGSSLIEHQRVHSGDRRFVCPLCGKSFTQASSLKKHQSIHTGEKRFRCSHCGKHFSDPSNLRKHVSIHTGERPFRCGQCGKTFNQSSNLKTHMKIHTGEKPFSCEGCGQVFAYKISLVNHQLKSCLGEQNLMGQLHMAPMEKRLDSSI